MNDKVELIANLSAEQRQRLLQNLRTQKAAQQVKEKWKLPEIVSISRDQNLPLSYAQQQLWLLDQMEGGSPHYNEVFVFDIKGAFNYSALQNSLTEIVKRHEVLRTIFPLQEKSPIQKIMLPESVLLPLIDLQKLSSVEQLLEIKNVITNEMHNPFYLAKGPLYRFSLLQNSEEFYVLVFTVHHIIYDGWSSAILIDELGALYEASIKNQPVSLPALSIQYADFAHWQRQWLDGDVLQKQLHYWQQQLADLPSVLELPTDKPRPLVQTFRGSKQLLDIPPEVFESLRKLSQQTNTSLFMMLLAAFVVLLHRYTGQRDIVVGSPSANRNHPALRLLIGYFVNMLVFRNKLPDKLRFIELLEQVKKMALEVYEHSDAPFEKLVEILKPERSLSYNPLFQVAFVFQNNIKTSNKIHWPGLHVELRAKEEVAARFDLSLYIEEFPDRLDAYLEYNTDLWHQETIIRMAEHFNILLQSIINNPQADIYGLALLTEAEIRQIAEWNRTETDYPRHKTIVGLFEEQVEKNSDNVAVVFEGQQLTYYELNQQANRLANTLVTIGVQADTLVGICVERSLEMIVGMLGILKAGGAYVPLEPNYPSERLRLMLEDSQVPVLVTQSHLRERLPVFHQAQLPWQIEVICLDEMEAFQSTDNPKRCNGPDDLAYVIYTSGSTGTPKGTCVPHRAVTRLVKNTDYILFDAKQTFLQYAPISFDAATLEIWGALLNSAKLVVAPTKQKSLDGLADILWQEKISVLWLTSSLFNVMLEEHLEALRGVKQLLAGGEALSVRHIHKALRELPDTQLVNGYGPTENTTFTCCYPIRNQQYSTSIPIGRPIANTQVFIVDQNHQPVPIGSVGELVTSGAGLARGYLNRPELTAEKFIEVDLFGQTQRIYKTGDLARWLPDGNLEYLGRIDHQVKLRGFRIELGEIEAVLSQHDTIKEAVVILHEREGHKSLAAYVTLITDQLPMNSGEVLRTDNRTLNTDLRIWLKDKLPDYMVPASFTVLDKLPLTPNGKADRKALSELDTAFNSDRYEPPRTGTEQQLADIWAGVLKRPDIGIHDNFFDLGGDSILSIQIVARARQAGLGISPRDIFQHQTLAELAQAVQPLQEIIAEQGLIQGKVALTPIQSWFFAGDNSEPWHFNHAILLEVPADLNEVAVRQTLAALLNHHDALRLRYRQVDGVWQQYHAAPASEIPFHLDTLAGSNFVEALNDRASYWQTSLNLEHGPLTRLVLFRHEQGTRLLWVIHHLAVDGVSWRVLLEDLNTAYRQTNVGKPLQLPAKTSSFQAWSEHLQQWLSHSDFAASADYWRQLPALNTQLPIDHPQGRNRVIDTCHHTLTFDSDTTRRLLEEAPSAYRTGINDLLLSALLLTLHEWGGQSQYAIDLESHGRADLFSDIDLSRTVGWFTALYSVVLSLPDSDDRGQIIKSIKEQLLQIPHDGIGYGLLRQQGEALPQGQILFNYLGQFDQSAGDAHDGFCLAQEECTGNSHSLTGSRDHLIEINGQAVHGQLSLTFSYSGEQYQVETIQSLADNYQKHLLSLIVHCQQHYGYTPSDFPLTQLNQQQLDSLTNVYQNNIVTIYPLTPMQQGMLFHSLYEPESDSGLYFEQIHCRLSGDVYQTTLRQAWQYLIDRHPVLRTVFHYGQDKPVQIVLKRGELLWTEYDWQTLTEEEHQQQRETLLAQARKQGFDLAQVPLMRLQLIQESSCTWQLLWHFHHILMDGWCLPILFTELFVVYNALRQQQTPRLPPVSSYQNYIAWLVQQDQQSAYNYWQEKLAGFVAPTPIPVAHHSQQAACYHEIYLNLTLEETRQINRFARQQRVTLNTVVQAAWAGILGRYRGETDIVFGTTTSGRNVPLHSIENMIGLFINTLPLRINLNTKITTLLHDLQVQQQQDNHYAYTNLADIQSWSEIPHGVALFDSIIVFENYPVDDALQKQQDLPFQISDFHAIEQTNYLLTLAIQPSEQMTFALSFDQHRIDHQASTRLLEHLHLLLKGITEQPEVSVQQLPLLTQVETQQLIAWNQTEADYFQDKTIVELFEAQVEKTPDNIAVMFESYRMTYAELNQQANQIAHALIALGVQTDILVGICMERSLEMLTGLLGILKAGGAYLPIDADYPQERLQFILEDVPVLLTQTQLQQRLPVLQQVQQPKPLKVVCLDETGAFQHQPRHNPARRSGPEDLAYVIYTSGSTGKPKGVMVGHHALALHLHAIQQSYTVQSQDRVLQFASIGFDTSLEQLLITWLNGACSVPVKNNVISAHDLLNLVQSQKISIADLPPAYWQQMLDINTTQATLPDLHTLILGGEALPWELAQHTRNSFPDINIFNAYGPTEAVITPTLYRLPFTLTDRNAYVSIGQPRTNTQVYILDTNHQMLPIGIPGELCIAGAGLARGYLNRPDLTAEKFVEVELFGKKQRIYKSGDLARWLSDGNLEYLGRIDHQVKLRGFRIELGEIESELTQHKAVREAVVILREREGNKALAAYLTMDNDELSTHHSSFINDLRARLKDNLPDYMVPATFTVLDKLPLTPNGKIDRKALPDPDTAFSSDRYEPPRTGIEHQLADIWSAVLKRPDIGIHDNFFDLGGDSILSIQIVARARQVDLDLSPRDVFQHQTIAELALAVQPVREIIAEQGLIQGEVALTPIQSWFFNSDNNEPWYFNQAMLLEVPADLNEATVRQVLSALLNHHDALRLRYRQVDGVWQQYHAAPDSDIPFCIETLADGDFVQALYERASHWQASLNLEHGPLTRLVLFRHEQGVRLLWVIHHLAVDGVSWRILLEDLNTTYHQANAGETLQLPAKTSSFQTWSERLQQWANQNDFAVDADYWRQQPQQVVNLPIDNPQGRNRIIDTREHILTLDTETTRRLLEEAPSAYRTGINDLLLSALLLTLYEWDGQEQYAIDLESHGSAELFDDLDISRTVGWFTALYCMVLTLSDSTDLGQVIKSVKEQLRQIPYEGIGYGLLLQQGETLSQGQILFNYLGQFDQIAADAHEGFRLAQEDSGQSGSSSGSRDHLIDINGETVHGQLSLTFSYSGEQYQAETIQSLANNYQKHLFSIIAYCQQHYGYTPSDFPLTSLTQQHLDALAVVYQNNIAAIYPLTPMQQGMLFHTLYEPDSGIYFEQIHCRFNGDVHPQTLRQAWQILLDRHPILRTAIRYDQDNPVQIVLKQVELSWMEDDWQMFSDVERQQKQAILLEETRQQGIDLAQAPLMRVQLIQEGPDSYRFFWHHHHILMDGWCLPIIFGELFAVYSALRQRQTPRLPPVNHYQNYIAWLVQQDQEGTRHYWQEKFAGFATPTPITIARYSQQAANYHETSLNLTVEDTQHINRFARQLRITLNTVVQAAWAGLLGRYSDETDIVFGAVTSGRNVPLHGIENMVGLFINTLPLRVNLNTDITTLLHELQLQQQEDNRYAYTSLADIQSQSQVPNGVALFDSIIVFENYPVDDALQKQQYLPFQINDYHAIEQTNYLLTLTVLPGEQLGFKLNFDQNRVETKVGTRLLEHLALLLKGITEQPEADIRTLPLLTEAEIQQLTEWNHSETVYSQDETIIARFENQVEKTPDNIAVAFENYSLTYAELNQQANRLAHTLIALDVKADTLVGICVERSLEMVTGLLGILKAGGAYVPLDPNYPRERLHFILEDSQVPVLLTQSRLQERLPELTAQVLCLDEAETFQHQWVTNPERRSEQADLAYVIYTSGSTGKPKGCLVTHGNVSRLFSATEHWYHFNQNEVWTLFHSYAFDFSVWELWGALCFGGKLVVVPYLTSRNPEAFLELLFEQQVTVLNQTPSAFSQLIQADQAKQNRYALKWVIFGGEALDLSGLKPWFAKHGDQQPQLVNMYGITETTVHVTFYPLSQQSSQYQASVIGQAIPDLHIYLLDRHKQPTPVGIPGELCIAGAGLARGYLNRPDLTAEKFVEVELFGKSQRIYKSGDLARWLPDGNLEYLGRIDHQVKLRGFRIELGEIESELTQHNAVREAVVILREREDNKALAAYLTTDNDELSTHHSSFINDLRTRLKDNLPDYMVPATFTVLDKLPLTPNGKIDRKALPDPDTAFSSDRYEPPRTDLEHQLAKIWSAVLKRPDIGIHDNFFDLGGDSILSIQIVARARQADLGISPRDVFQYQTIAELAQVAQTLHKITAEQGLVQGEVPLIPIQQQFFEQNFPEYWHYNQSILLRIPNDIDIEALRQGLSILLSHHDALRFRYHYVSVSDHWVQSCSASSETVPFFVEDLRQSQNPAVELQQLIENYQSSLNISNGPLTHLVIFRLADSTRLFWCIHHLAVDGVSWRILLEDLHTVYTQIAAAQSPQLPDKTSSFKFWAERLTAYAQTPALTDELAYWNALPTTLSFPIDNPDGKNRLEYTHSCSIVLSYEETESLLREVPAAYNTRINDVLLTALALAVADWCGETQCLIDLEGHGRVDLFPDIDLSRTVGWFTTVYPVLLNLPANLELGASLKAIKEQLRLIPHEGIGYGLLSYLNKETLPKCDIVFNYLGQFDQSMEADLFAFADEAVGSDISLNGTRDHLLEINGAITQGQLSLSWSYSSECYRAETIETLAKAYHTRLITLIHHCQTALVKRPSLKTLVPLNVHDDRQAGLFCLPGSGSKAGYFHTLAKTLESNLSIYGLESPGLDGHERIPETVEALAQAHLETIRAVQPHGPYYFIGHSFGVAVAFELAWLLEQAGEDVALMALLDQVTPQYFPEDHPIKRETEIDTMWSIIHIIKALAEIEAPFKLQDLKKTNSFNYACRTVMNWLKQENAQEILFSPQAAPEELCALVKVYRTNMLAFPAYQLQGKRLRCAIDLICTEESIKENKELPDNDWGWNEHTIAGIRRHHMKGEHINMILHPHVQVLVNILKDILVHAL